MTDRYFVQPPISGDTAVLAGPEAHHLAHVMRAKPGDRLTLFDDSQTEFPSEVRRIGRGEVVLNVVARREIDRELPIELTLAVSLPKGDRQKWLVEKCTEVGVSRIVPVITTHSVAQPGPPAIARLVRAVIEASKQCGRNRLLAIHDAQSWAEFVAASTDVPLRLIAQPGADTTPADLRQIDLPSRVAIAVGPEGGFTPEEVELALTAGWLAVDLGPRTLRIETAALILSGFVTLWGSTSRPGR